MAYKDATWIDGSNFSKLVQCFVSPNILPFDVGNTLIDNGLVLGYLPKKTFILNAWLLETVTGGQVFNLPVELKINGRAVAISRYYAEGATVELKRTNESGITKPYVYVIEYMNLGEDTGLSYQTKVPAIASDGSIARR